MDAIKEVENELIDGNDHPDFRPGDTVSVDYKIREGNKERVQRFQGTVIQRKGSGGHETFTVRKISGGVGVERIFPLASPFIQKIKVDKKGKVRQGRINYIRNKVGKAARVKERRGANEGNGKDRKGS
jgi:large subunit ribosomal protein L19